MVAVVVLVVVIVHSCDRGQFEIRYLIVFLAWNSLYRWFVHEEGGRNEMIWVSANCVP